MRILLINIRFGYVGGPERYLFNLKELLESHQHTVVPFSIQYRLNEPTEYENYFVPPLSNNESVYFKDQKWDIRTLIKTLERNVYSQEVERSLSRLIVDTKPDFAIVLLYLRKLSPAVLVALDRHKIPFIVRLSDFGMICPGSTLFKQKAICELCIKGNLLNSVRHKCVHNSAIASLVNYCSTKYHHSKKYFDLIPYFVVPSRFTIQKMTEGGWNKERFGYLPTMVYPPAEKIVSKKKNQIVYTGRLDFIKGVHVLLKALKILSGDSSVPFALKLAGNGDEAYINYLKEYIQQEKLKGIEFCGNLKRRELQHLLMESAFSVTPSLWFDNTPNSLLESLSCGTPAIAPAHGCFTDLIIDGENGLLFRNADENDLASRIRRMLSEPDLTAIMGVKAIDFVKKFHSPEGHYQQLLQIIEKLVPGGATDPRNTF